MRDRECSPIKRVEWDYEKVMEHTTMPMPNGLIFRGVGNSTYGLVPSAYRNDGLTKLKAETRHILEKNYAKDIVGQKGFDTSFYEIMALLWFYDIANRQGLRVPDIPFQYSGITYIDAMNWERDGTYQRNWSEIAAVAQHYGIPTRMLDWTFDMNVALFFAVKDVPDFKVGVRHSEHVSLWILDQAEVQSLGSKIRFVVPKYCDNPNIRAQSGLFTLVTGDEPGKDLEEVIRDLYEAADQRSRHHARNGPTFLTKVDIPFDDAAFIKDNFKSRGISYDSVFPGWSGVVESMEIQSGIRKA